MKDDTISRAAAIELFKDDIAAVNELNNLPSLPDRMKYVQEAVNTIMNTCKSDSIKDKAFRNAARFIQNAIDGEAPDFETIEELPSAQPGWIPCSIALPKTEEKVLITCEYLDIYGKPHRYVCKAFHVDRYTMISDKDWWDEGCDEYREEDDQYYALEGWYEFVHNWGDYNSVRITEDKVVAWMPLPTPYREGGCNA